MATSTERMHVASTGKATMPDAADRLAVVNTSSNLMSVELKQLDELTCGTSVGSASVTSAH